MEHNYRWLNRTRLNVHLLESRIQPGSLFMTGPVEMGAGPCRCSAGPRSLHRLAQRSGAAHRIDPNHAGCRAASNGRVYTGHGGSPRPLFDHAQLRAGVIRGCSPGRSVGSGNQHAIADGAAACRQRRDRPAKAASPTSRPRRPLFLRAAMCDSAVNVRSADNSRLAVPVGFTPVSNTSSQSTVSDGTEADDCRELRPVAAELRAECRAV